MVAEHRFEMQLNSTGDKEIHQQTEVLRNGDEDLKSEATIMTTPTSSSSSETTRITPPLLVASQDDVLSHLCRQSARVPVIRLARGSVLLLEQPSHAAQSAQQHAERSKWTVRGSVPEQEQLLVDLVKQKERQEQRRTTTAVAPNPHQQQQRRKRKAKGPNPLSCKKKKDDKPKAKKKI